jgi:hypothetical protein
MAETSIARLLIVDDEVAQMQALRDTLQAHGYAAVGCTSGAEGLAALHEQSFDMLLADLTMPGMGGIELLRAALAIDPMLAGVIMTGAGTIESAVQAMQSGALDYILKPFRLSAILPVLARGLALRHLRQENAALERRVRERTAELEAANVELDAFSRTVSHDLRNPLHAIIGFAGLVRTRYGAQIPAEAGAWVAQVENAGRRMNQLIDDLLRLARLGRQALQLAPVDLGALVQAVVDERRQSMLDDHATLLIGPLPQVVADAALLRQVFINLLSNACKFTRDTPQARVEVGCTTTDGELVFFVRDNGPGFDMAQAHKLFGAFERLHSAEEFEGTGVGLSTVQRIVQRHGGRVWAHAEPGRGATFCFTLRATGA